MEIRSIISLLSEYSSGVVQILKSITFIPKISRVYFAISLSSGEELLESLPKKQNLSYPL